MGSISGDDLSYCGSPKSSYNEERILVSVRLRPLNDKELERNDVSEWECINTNTILFKNSIAERSTSPTAYTFDRVFGCDSSTEQVYEEAAKEVVLSVMSGINSTIFAYGQTNSGKTYTMFGITESTVADIFDYIDKHNDREFTLKFSAIEIYNESVRDLLSPDITPLRLLDDPERGTVVEKLTEEIVKDWGHLKDLLSICEAQRQIGETSLNEVSSRSHQILRLTIESSSCEFLGAQKSSTLAASVNFVDLAGSERASQAMSAGTRLKEGCHINRSLLTLGTVIRKLSKGRNAHIPYRDSKLTRILQNSLGGNARTAIICTMSPARSQVEQSKNTLLFASCAKEVSTNAHVNLVVSDKALVKQLQRELAKLETELKKSASMPVMPNSAAELKEKELLIQKMENEIKELKDQRDHALSRVQDLLGSGGEYHEYQVSRPLAEGNLLLKPYVHNAWVGECSASETSDVVDPRHSDVASSASLRSDRYDFIDSNKNEFNLLENVDDHFLSDATSPREEIEKLFGPDPSKGWEMAVHKQLKDSEDHCKEVQCINESNTVTNIKSNTQFTTKDGNENLSEIDMSPKYEALKKKIKEMQKTISYLVSSHPTDGSPRLSEPDKSSFKLTKSRSCRAFFSPATVFPHMEKTEENKNTPPSVFEIDFLGRLKSNQSMKISKLKFEEDVGYLSGKSSPVSVKATLVDEKKVDIKHPLETDALSVMSCATEIDETLLLQLEQEFGDDPIQEAKPNTEPLTEFVDLKPQESTKEVAQRIGTEEKIDVNNPEDDIILEATSNTPKSLENTEQAVNMVKNPLQSHSNWPLEFERQQREIIEFWDACNVPLAHRTRFFLLFKGDPSDSVYLEVELRRLSFLRSKLFQGTLVVDGQMLTLALSKRALNRERRMLSKQMMKKFSTKAREALYQKWDIDLNSKLRRQQLCLKLWTKTKDMIHINESASIVAKLVGFSESDQTAKEMFGFNLLPRSISRSKSLSWT